MSLLDDALDLKSVLADLAALATQDVAAAWQRVRDLPPGELQDYLVAALPDLIDPFASAAGVLTAQWYEDQDPASRFTPKVADLPPRGALAVSTRWALGPVFGRGRGDALTMLGGVAQRAVFSTSRQTITENVQRESGAMYARHASRNACTFCKLLATRGAVYGSERSAGRVVGRGRDLTAAERRARAAGTERVDGRRIPQGRRPRGVRALDDKFHDDCHCTAVAVRPGRTYEPPPYVAEWEQQYSAARRTGASSPADILSAMRAMEPGAH